ncbi:MAG TPA: hypothetical protein VFA18_02990 [Gemmataceae bacterium]|nr:hypothetical protein [Gemmataceae bacterium]
MRVFAVCLVSLLCAGGVLAQKASPPPAARFGYQPDLEHYPQSTPRDALGSVLKAIQNRRLGYLLAQLTDPAWVDDRVRTVHGGKFDDLIKETDDQFSHDPGALKTLEAIFKNGTWRESGDTAEGQVKGSDDHAFFKHVGDRWFLENRKK